MEDALFTSTVSGAMSDTTNMDFGMMDDLLLEGCWLETTDFSNLLQQGDNTSATLLDSSCFSPTSDICNNSPYANAPPNGVDDTGKLDFSGASAISGTQIQSCAGVQTLYHNTAGGAASSGQSDFYLAEEGGNLEGCEMISPSSELSKRWWIQPRTGAGPASSVKERLVHVLNCIKESTKDGDVLVQIWVPIKEGGRKVLTTCGQPFSLNPHCQRLVNYRTVSTNYLFSAEENSDMAAGLPGRVFLGRLPEWTPDVRYFSSEEFPRVDYAHQYDVRGTIALPVFEQGSGACLGVVEVVRTTQKSNYRPDLENICSALQAVDLRTSEVLSIPYLQASNNSYQVVIPEIQEIMRAVCETHHLPLAQTWVPCIQQGKLGSRHTDENYAYCVSTIDAACLIIDPDIRRFHEACSEHHLFRGQGVVGKAFTTNQPCFSMDITAFSKTEYPLSHHARMFGLQAAVAVHLRSIYTGKTDYVLEFFLPVDCRNHEEQKLMLNSLSVIIQHFCRSLQVVTEKQLDDENGFSVNKPIPSDKLLGKSISAGRPNINEMSEVGFSPSTETSGEKSSSTCIVQQKGKNVLYPAGMQLEFQEQETNELNVTGHWDDPQMVLHTGRISSDIKQHQQAKDDVEGKDSSFGKSSVKNAGNTTAKRRIKTEKTVSLQVLRQYFAGSLKDAAKSIGVCPTTLKRICRQHGITRWPSRKIKKVGNSLKKLQVVIDSVEGAKGVVQISSLYTNFPKKYGSGLTSQNLSASEMLSELEWETHPKFSTAQPEGVFSTGASLEKSQTSSCSQSSSSSLSCSTAAQSQPHATQLVVNEDALKTENRSCILKRAYSEAELHSLSKEEEMGPLSRSHSHRSLCEHPPSSFPKRVSSPRDCNSVKVKVTYGDDKVRFKLQPSWGFQDLKREIVNRFNMDDASAIDLKYLDDDSEWVLLTCDADLKECKDLCKSSSMHVIKLSAHLVAQPDMRNCLGNTALS